MGWMEGERDAGMLVGLARGKWRGVLEGTATWCGEDGERRVLEGTATWCGEDGERRVLEGTATWCGEDGERVCIVSVDSAGKMVVSVGDR